MSNKCSRGSQTSPDVVYADVEAILLPLKGFITQQHDAYEVIVELCSRETEDAWQQGLAETSKLLPLLEATALELVLARRKLQDQLQLRRGELERLHEQTQDDQQRLDALKAKAQEIDVSHGHRQESLKL